MVNFKDRTALAFTLLRVATGAVFVAHGAQKVLGLFGGSGLEGFAQWGATLGIPSSLAYAAAFCRINWRTFIAIRYRGVFRTILMVWNARCYLVCASG